jgi:hypothetical protein
MMLRGGRQLTLRSPGARVVLLGAAFVSIHWSSSSSS